MKRVVARCEGCRDEIVLAQEEEDSYTHLSTSEFQAFLDAHERCRRKVAGEHFVSWHIED